MRALVPCLLVFAVSCQCGAGDLCASVVCRVGVCDPKSGLCHVTPGSVGGGAGGGTAGGAATAGGAGGAGGGQVATCQPACMAPNPYCESFVCVECRTGFDCASGFSCQQGACVQLPGTGGGSSGAGGGSAGTGGGGGNTTTVVEFDDAGSSAHCLALDAGVAQCTTECPRGYHCVNGQCVLNGTGGEVQVTLRINQPEDIDLHVVEPLPDGGQCEIWYGSPNTTFDAGFPFPFPFPLGCGALGSLDLDTNAACTIDNVDVENIIYPTAASPTAGVYTVRVDDYQACFPPGVVPFEVEVRAFGQSRYWCGTFTNPGDADNGSAGSGRTITTFSIH